MRKIAPQSTRSTFGSPKALKADSPTLGVEPAADTNVMRVTKTNLFLRPAYASLYGGRRSMSWWATIMLYFTTASLIILGYPGYSYSKEYEGFHGSYLNFWMENVDEILGIPFLMFAGCFWMFIPWRRQLPVIFNRHKKTVTCYIEGRVVSCDWSSLEAYIKNITTIAVGGAPISEGVLQLVFPNDGSRRSRSPSIGIKATEDVPAAIINGGSYGAGMIWEYIRLYMNEGIDAVPPPAPEANYRATGIRDCIDFMNPWMPFTYRAWWKLLVAIILSPILVPFLTCVLLGDITYMVLDRVLPRRKWPQELIDACDGVWNGEE